MALKFLSTLPFVKEARIDNENVQLENFLLVGKLDMDDWAVDVDCLRVQLALVLINIPFQLVPNLQPEASSSGHLPVFIYENDAYFNGIEQINVLLEEKCGYLIDSKEASLLSLLNDKIRPIIWFSIWIDPDGDAYAQKQTSSSVALLNMPRFLKAMLTSQARTPLRRLIFSYLDDKSSTKAVYDELNYSLELIENALLEDSETLPWLSKKEVPGLSDCTLLSIIHIMLGKGEDITDHLPVLRHAVLSRKALIDYHSRGMNWFKSKSK